MPTPPNNPGVRVSVRDAVRNGLVRAGGSSEAVLAAAEREFLAAPPRTSVEAFAMMDRAARSVNPVFSAGLPVDLLPVVPGFDKLLVNTGGRTTLLKADGEVVVADGAGNVLLHLVPPP